MKNAGRIIMLVAAFLFVATGLVAFFAESLQEFQDIISEFLPTFEEAGVLDKLKAIFGEFKNPVVQAALVKAGYQMLSIVIGLSALIVCLKGKVGFMSFVAAGVMLGWFIWYIVNKVRSDKAFFKDTGAILSFAKEIVNYALYVAGVIILIIANKKEKHDIKEFKKAKRAGQI